MPARLTTLVGLSLFGIPAIASRAHLDLLAKTRGALAQREDVKANTSGVARGDSDTPCVCMLKEVETEHEFNHLRRLRFADHAEVEFQYEYQSQTECSKRCPLKCHNKMKYKYEAADAAVFGVEYAVAASKCSPGGDCKCLDALTTMQRANEYKSLESQRVDIATVKQVHKTAGECLEHCDCFDERTRSPLSDREFHSEGLCAVRWQWGLYLYRNQYCPYLSKSIGIVNCEFVQEFTISSQGEVTRLDKLVENKEDGHEIEENIALRVMTFGEETSKYYKTSEVTVGPRGVKNTKWSVYKTNIVGTRWSWTVEDEYGEVQFTINQQKWSSVLGAVWKVYAGTKSGGQHVYYAYGDEKAGKNELGFKYKFYRDDTKAHYAGKLTHWGYQAQVKVMPGEDSGLILMACVLIGKAFDAATD